MLMAAFEFSDPLAIFVDVKVSNLSWNADQFCLHRLHNKVS